MAQIIKQPDGRYAIFSTVSDTFERLDCTVEEVVEFFVDRAIEDAVAATNRKLEEIERRPHRPYAQVTITWKQAVKMNAEHRGELTP